MEDLKIYTTEQIAEMLQVDTDTVRNYIKNGRLGAFKIGRDYRITEKDLYNYVEAYRNKKVVK